MKSKFLLAILIIFSCFKGYSQVSFVVPLGRDTSFCGPATFTLQNTLEGFTPTRIGFYPDDSDDGTSTIVIPIGFSFDFYGTVYDRCIISSNGFIQFDTTLVDAYSDWDITTDGGIPGDAVCENSCLGLFSDILLAAGGGVWYGTTGVAPNRKFIVEFCNTHMFSCTSQSCTFQMILYEGTNIFESHIRHKEICTGWDDGAGIEGVENAPYTVATAAIGRNYPDPAWFVSIPDARRFTPDSTFSSYTVDTIPYNPVPYNGSLIYWFDSSTGALLDSGATATLTTTVTTTYIVEAYSCNDTDYAYSTVIINPIPNIDAISFASPTSCGSCNGTITLYGITPGYSDTITYDYNGTLSVPIATTAATDSTITLSGLCPGTYDNFTIKLGPCTYTFFDTVKLTAPPISFDGLLNTQPLYCGDTASITLEGLVPGSSDTIYYMLGGVLQPLVVGVPSADSELALTGLLAGTYSDFYVHVGYCIDSNPGPVTITNPPYTISGFAFTNTACSVNDGTITLTGLVPFDSSVTINYTIGGVAQTPTVTTISSSGTVELTGLGAGVYNGITVTLSAGCIAGPEGPITIVAPPITQILLTNATNPSGCGKCDGSITISGTTPLIFDTIFYNVNGTTWDTALYSTTPDSLVTMYGLCAGTYDTLFMKQGNCPTDTLYNIVLTAPTITPGYTDAIHYGCISDSVFFMNAATTTATGDHLYYVWNFGDSTSNTLSNPEHIYTAMGTYTVVQTVTNNYCVLFDTSTVTLNNAFSAVFTPSPGLVCQDGPVTFLNNSETAMGTLSYMWYFGDGNTSTLMNPSNTFVTSGTYSVMLVATNFVPCNDTAIEIVQVDTQSSISMNITDTTICLGTYMTFSGIFASLGDTGVIWNFDNGDTIKGANPVPYGYSSVGVYTVSVVAQYRACETVTTTGKVTVIPQPSINVGGDTSICLGSSPIVYTDYTNEGNPLASWLWSTGATTPSISIAGPGNYWVTVSINNCWASDSIVVSNSCYMDMPNVFTPNGDGVNDYFFPRQQLTKGLASFSMNIYNRWGQLVFTTNTLDGRGWDGRFNDVPQPEDVYIYIIDATFIDGQKEHHQGNVTLLR